MQGNVIVFLEEASHIKIFWIRSGWIPEKLCVCGSRHKFGAYFLWL